MVEYDKYFTLKGDEDGDVHVECIRCNRRGMPTIFYGNRSSAMSWVDADVIVVDRIDAMLAAMSDHITWHLANPQLLKE